MNMMIKPIASMPIFEAATVAAKQDGHILVAPTHVLSKDSEIVGAISMMPMALVWTDSKQVKVRESLDMEKTLSASQAFLGQRVLCLPCTKQSPYFNLLNKVGYVNLGEYNLFVKGLQ